MMQNLPLRPAHLGWRVAQTTVDAAVVVLCVSAIALVSGSLSDVPALPSLGDISREPIHSTRHLVRLLPTAGTLLVLYLIAKLLYYTTLLTYCGGQTIGCWLFRLRVVGSDGQPLNWSQAFARTFIGGAMGSIPVIGRALRLADYVISLFGRKKQALRDLAAGTMLVHMDPVYD